MKPSLRANTLAANERFDSTYEGLKLRLLGIRRSLGVRFDSTYEGLKLIALQLLGKELERFDSTYEGLKRGASPYWQESA